MPQMAPDQKREYLITYLADVVILAQAADKQKIGDRDDVKHRLDFERNKVLMETLLQDTGKAALTDDAMHKVYDDAVKQMPPEEEVHARHILVPTEDGGQGRSKTELKKGADFATLAKEKSKDPGAAEGGDLGYFTKDQMVPEFSDVAVQARQGPDFRSGEDAVRLAHHQGRGQAHQADADLRSRSRASSRAYVAHKAQAELVDKSAQIRHYRAPRPAAGGGSDPSTLNPAAPAKK